MDLKKMIEKLFGQDEKYRQPPKNWSTNRPSKHMLPSGVKATKKYADGRQKSPHNRRDMRKRK